MTLSGCSETPSLRTGDLLFTVGANSAMTEAITAATGSEKLLNFSHVGIAVVSNEVDSVLEATPSRGVRMISLEAFQQQAARIGNRPAVVAMRLKDTTGVTAAVHRARSYIGQPYDYSFRPDNGRIYCSELIWESYRTPDGNPRFAARPMNFRAADGSMPAFWVKLFERLGEPIPQGEPGTNPNELARDDALEEIGRYF